MIEVAFICSIVSAVLVVITMPIAIFALVEVRAMAKSTHQIQYMPVDIDGANSVNYVDDHNISKQNDLVKGMNKMHNLEDDFGDL